MVAEVSRRPGRPGAGAAPEPGSPLLQRLPLTIKGRDSQLYIDDSQGHWVLTLSGLLAEERAFLVQLADLANAYPRLKAQLDKALEACRALLACEAGRQAASKELSGASVKPVELEPDRKLYLCAVDKAREALEMEG